MIEKVKKNTGFRNYYKTPAYWFQAIKTNLKKIQ